AEPAPSVNRALQRLDVVEGRCDDADDRRGCHRLSVDRWPMAARRSADARQPNACRLNVMGRCTPPGSSRAAGWRPSLDARAQAPRRPPFGGSSGAPDSTEILVNPARSSACFSDRGEKWLTWTRLSATVGR